MKAFMLVYPAAIADGRYGLWPRLEDHKCSAYGRAAIAVAMQRLCWNLQGGDRQFRGCRCKSGIAGPKGFAC
mgnify:CR=1 FL=1